VSQPAKKVRPGEPAPRVRRSARSAPSVRPARRMVPAPAPGSGARVRVPGSPRPAQTVARRKGTAGFLILSTIVAGSMVLGLVTLSVLLAQSSFRIDDLEQRVSALRQDNLELTHEQATLSAPGRIAGWARRHDMRLPDEIQFLHVSKAGPTAPAGEADELARVERKLDRLLGADG